MSDYIYGNWFCKPANESEAKEIFERAIASGAVNTDGLRGNSMRYDYGVSNGRVVCGYSLGIEYTLAELRQKFLLPGERVEEPKQWHGHEDGLPPVGWHGECSWGTSADWFECVMCPGEKVAHAFENSKEWVVGSCEYFNFKFRPMRTERDKWVDAAARIPKPCGFALVPMLEQIYDAMKSGKLELPEVKE